EVVAKHRQGQPRKSGARLSKEKEIVGQRIASVIITTVTATWRRTTPRRASGLRRPLTKGFDWQGTIYSSLSAIARAITGTAWSGPPVLRSWARERGPRTSQHELKRQGAAPWIRTHIL